MTPDYEEALVENFRVRVGAVIADVYATIGEAATDEDEIIGLHKRLMADVMLLAALMQMEIVGESEREFVALARQAWLCGLTPNGSKPQ